MLTQSSPRPKERTWKVLAIERGRLGRVAPCPRLARAELDVELDLIEIAAVALRLLTLGLRRVSSRMQGVVKRT